MQVTVLEKPEGQTWSDAEVAALTAASSEVQMLPRLPRRLVLLNKPLRGTIKTALGHTNYTTKEVDYHDRWS